MLWTANYSDILVQVKKSTIFNELKTTSVSAIIVDIFKVLSSCADSLSEIETLGKWFMTTPSNYYDLWQLLTTLLAERLLSVVRRPSRSSITPLYKWALLSVSPYPSPLVVSKKHLRSSSAKCYHSPKSYTTLCKTQTQVHEMPRLRIILRI